MFALVFTGTIHKLMGSQCDFIREIMGSNRDLLHHGLCWSCGEPALCVLTPDFSTYELLSSSFQFADKNNVQKLYCRHSGNGTNPRTGRYPTQCFP